MSDRGQDRVRAHVIWYFMAAASACAAAGILYGFWSWRALGLGWLFGALVLINVAVACVAIGIGRRDRSASRSG